MYIYKTFQVQEKEHLHHFMQTYSFATLITHNDGMPWATHIPILLDAEEGEHGKLIAHFARANPQRHMLSQGEEALVIFHGPHAYISPAWYEIQEHDDAPTWNYTVVHAYGRPHLFDDERRLYDLLIRLIASNERGQEHPWTLKMSFEEARPQIKGIIGFEMDITRIEGNFKLSQSRSRTDKERVYHRLRQRDDQQDRHLAEMMKKYAMKEEG